MKYPKRMKLKLYETKQFLRGKYQSYPYYRNECVRAEHRNQTGTPEHDSASNGRSYNSYE